MDFIYVGDIVNTHGLKGEIRITSDFKFKKTAFEIGFIVFVPFIVLDLIVANILLALGMFMLSPTIISLPFKLLIFIAVDGWGLIVNGLVGSFN